MGKKPKKQVKVLTEREKAIREIYKLVLESENPIFENVRYAAELFDYDECRNGIMELLKELYPAAFEMEDFEKLKLSKNHWLRAIDVFWQNITVDGDPDAVADDIFQNSDMVSLLGILSMIAEKIQDIDVPGLLSEVKELRQQVKKLEKETRKKGNEDHREANAALQDRFAKQAAEISDLNRRILKEQAIWEHKLSDMEKFYQEKVAKLENEIHLLTSEPQEPEVERMEEEFVQCDILDLPELPETNVLFLGGHINMVKQLKQKHPKWRFMTDNQFSAGSISTVETVFMWSNHMSHALGENIRKSLKGDYDLFYVTSTNLDLLENEMKMKLRNIQYALT